MQTSRTQQEELIAHGSSGLVTFLGQSSLAPQRWSCCRVATICLGMLRLLIQVSWPQTPIIGPKGSMREWLPQGMCEGLSWPRCK